MDPLGLAVIVAVLVVAATMGLWRRRTDGAIRDEATEKRRRRRLLEEAGLELAPERDTSSTGKASTAAFAAATATAAAVHQAAAVHPPQQLTEPGPEAEPPTRAEPPTVAEPQTRAELSAAAEAPATRVRELTPDRTEEPGVVEREDDRPDPALLARLGVGEAKATILQFSSAFCAPCRAVRRVSTEVAEVLPGVQHVEVDAESHLDEVRELNIWRTPTLLLLDADGRVVKRATGVPSKPQLAAAVAEILTDEP